MRVQQELFNLGVALILGITLVLALCDLAGLI